MNALPLDDPRWRELDHRNWRNGKPSDWAPAALKGHRNLAIVLQDIDCICGECPKCGETVYPDELQAVIS